MATKTFEAMTYEIKNIQQSINTLKKIAILYKRRRTSKHNYYADIIRTAIIAFHDSTGTSIKEIISYANAHFQGKEGINITSRNFTLAIETMIKEGVVKIHPINRDSYILVGGVFDTKKPITIHTQKTLVCKRRSWL